MNKNSKTYQFLISKKEDLYSMIENILKARRKIHVQKLSTTHPVLIVLKANTPGIDKNRFSSFFLINQLNHLIEGSYIFNYKKLVKGL